MPSTLLLLASVCLLLMNRQGQQTIAYNLRPIDVAHRKEEGFGQGSNCENIIYIYIYIYIILISSSNSGSGILHPVIRILDSESRILVLDPGSRILDPEY